MCSDAILLKILLSRSLDTSYLEAWIPYGEVILVTIKYS